MTRAIACAAAIALATNGAAQTTTDQAVGTLVVAHGAGEEWNARVMEVVRVARTGPIEVAFLMGPAAATHRFQDAVERLASAGVREIVVVPMLVSSHSGHYEQIRWLAGLTDTLSEVMRHHLEMAGIERPAVRVAIRLAAAMDDAPELAEVLSDRALAVVAEAEGRGLLLAAHGPNGPEDVAEWMTALRKVAQHVRERTGFADVRVALLQDDAPPAVRAEAVLRMREIVELQHAATDRPVVVVPVLVSKGTVGNEKLAADLTGLPIAYDGEPLLPHPAMARWIERMLREPVGRLLR